MIISGPNAHNINKVLDKAADYLCENFYPKAFEDFKNDPDHYGFSCADNDVNFMLYSFLLACQQRFTLLLDHNDIRRFQIKRPDGGNFIAYAHAASDVDKNNENGYDPHWACGYMTRCKWCVTPEETQTHDCAFESVSANCRFIDRKGGWEDNLCSDWEALTKFVVKGKDSLSPEEYKRITDKGYIYGDTVQTVVYKAKLSDNETLSYSAVRFLEKRIPLSKEITELSKRLSEEAFDLLKNDYPEHIRPIVKGTLCTGIISQAGILPRCIERLLEKGALKQLTDVQKKAALAILEIK